MTKKLKKTTAFLSAVAMVMAMLLYFPSGMFSNIDWGLKASAEGETQTENWIDSAATEFTGGTGTEGDPYQIETADQLAYLAQQVNAGTNYSEVFFKLTADIDLGGKGWTPIGTDNSNAFKGDFSGNGYKIKNLTINKPGDSCIGLFGYISFGKIMNVGIEGGSVTGGYGVGGVCGHSSDSVIENCYNTASVTGNADVGGVCGYSYGTILNCYNTGDIIGKESTSESGSETQKSSKVGGVCGENCGTIANCYNTGKVSGLEKVGGVCGNNNQGTISNCYYLEGKAGNGIGNNLGSAVPKTLNELCELDLDDDGTAWTAGSYKEETNGRMRTLTYTLPSLNGVGTALTTELNYYNFSTTETAEWQEYTPITDAAGLQAINDNLSGNYVLMNDIDLSTVADFTPIGTFGNAFTGKFSGDGHKIKNLTINSESDYIGLFVYSKGTIMNVGIEGGSVTGICFVGGVCGYNEGGTISNCYNTGSVTGAEYVGGVCGENYQGTISNCYNTGDIIGKAKTSSSFESTLPGSGESNHVGGVCGDNYQGTITNCYNTGEVTGEEYVGGVCGDNFRGTISNCYYLAGKATGGINGSDVNGSAKAIEYTTLCDDTKLPTGFDSSVWANGKITGYNPIDEGSRFGTEVFVLPSLIDVGTAQTISKGTDKLFYNFGTTETADWQEYISISTAEELKAIGKDSTSLSKNYVLREDIDLEEITDFTPIGTDENNAFTGKFSGNGHKITNLTINSESNKVGLFGCSNGTIMNVGIEGGSVTGKDSVGGVCGWNNFGTISNCYNTGSVTGTGYDVGGVCGYNCAGTISNCYNTGNVSGSSNVGGVCGYSFGQIENCYFDSKVYNGNAVGYNYGTVSGNVLGKTTKQFTSGEVAYLLSQDGSVWGQEIGKDLYPVLGGKKVYLTTGECVYYTNIFYEEEQSHSYNNNNGICDNCGGYEPAKQNSNGEYEISNAGQLYWFAALVNKGGDNLSAHAVLTANIIVNTGTDENAVANCGGTKQDGWIDWTPIGNQSNQFSGTFDGQGHTISGLYFNNPETDYVGLVGYINTGIIKNVGVVDSYFNGKIHVGGVCGFNIANSTATITNCYNTGAVSGTSYVGGVCGLNDGGAITNCYNTGTVSGNNNVGAVCGYTTGGTIANCYYLADTADENGGKTTAQFTSGEVAYLLQSEQTAVNGTIPKVWGQTLTGENKQNFPVLGGEKVYGGYINCGDTEMNYSNSSEGLREDSEHHYGTWKLSTFPGCTTNGAISKYCKYCDDCQSIEFDPIGHDYEYTELENAQHSKVCKRCSDTVTEDCTYKNGICTLCGGKQLHTITIINGSLTKGVTKHGNAVTVTADAAESGKVFAYWQDADGKILSYNAVYSFIVTSDKTITAVYSEQEIEKVGKVYINSVTEDLENHKMIVNSVADVPEGFKIVYAGLLASNEMDPGTSTDYGTVNTKVGSVFVRGMTTSKLATSLTWTKSSISYGETWYIRAYLVYEDNNGVQHTVYGELIKEIFDYQYEVSVENGTGSGTYYNGKILTISADTVDGKEFAGWLDNETNTIVSYNENYSFIVSKNRSFTAQYSEVAVEKLGTAIIENVTKDTVNNKLSFVSFCNVPEGCEIIYAGVVAKNGSDPGTETDFGTANTQTSDGTFVRGMTSTKSSARLTWTKSNVSAEDTWYVRAYLVYKNSNGETKTVFGDVTETRLGE